MRKFLIRGSVFLLIFALLLTFLNEKYKSTETFKHMNNTYKFFHVPENIELANLGSSHAQYGFYYEDLDITTFNFALPAQRLYYDLKILNKFIDSFSPNASVIIPVNFFSFYLGYDNENFHEFNKMYYSFLNPLEIKSFELSSFIKLRVLPIMTAEDNLIKIFKEDKDREIQLYKNYTVSEEKMAIEGEETALRHLGFIEEGQENREDFKGILASIIKLCIQNDLNPIVVVIPTTEYYTKHFSADFLDSFQSDLAEVLEPFPEAKFLDYLHDEEFVLHPEYFFDSSHLNLTGAKIFTQRVIEDIQR